MVLLALQFMLVSAVVIFAGSRLSFYGDVISERTGMGRTWVGAVVVAALTSLPELFTGTSSVLLADAPDIAVSDILGSCVFNLTIIAMLDLAYRPGAILAKAEQGHILAAGFGILALATVALGLFLAQVMAAPALGPIGFYSPMLLFTYFLGMRTIYRYEQSEIQKERRQLTKSLRYREIRRKKALALFAFYGALIVLGASFLPFLGKNLADQSGLGQTFVGALLIAITTSLPEVTTSLAALKLGAIDLAIGGLLGSNLFNLAILAVDDLLYSPRPILEAVSPSNMVPALAAVIMSAIAILVLFYQPRTSRVWRISWLGATIFAIYLINSYGIYALEHRG